VRDISWGHKAGKSKQSTNIHATNQQPANSQVPGSNQQEPTGSNGHVGPINQRGQPSKKRKKKEKKFPSRGIPSRIKSTAKKKKKKKKKKNR
jgi:hypothetical protein